MNTAAAKAFESIPPLARSKVVAMVLADAALERFGADTMDELVAGWHDDRTRTARRFGRIG